MFIEEKEREKGQIQIFDGNLAELFTLKIFVV